MGVNRDEFFALLDGLTDKEIEARLPLFDSGELALVQEYVERSVVDQIKTARGGGIIDSARSAKVALAALKMANAADTKALAALILSVGAILTAVLCGIILVMRN
jgi:hypothetical protein